MSAPANRTFRMTTHIAKRGAKHAINADRERFKLMKGEHAPHGPKVSNKLKQDKIFKTKPFATDASSINVTDAGVTYTMEVGVGKGTYTLLIDTGSSNTWVGAQSSNPYKKGPKGQETGETVKVSYGSGSFSGKEVTDTVVLGETLTITGQGVGAADPSTAQGFTDVDGILGIGPADLTAGTTSGGETVPTVTDNAYAQKLISSASIGISYVPTTSSGDNATAESHKNAKDGLLNGELTFGGTDSNKFSGELSMVDLTTKSPASAYWGIDQTIKYGKTASSGKTILKETAGIVDTGTTLLYMATEAFTAYQDATGGVPDKQTGLLKITEDQFNALESLWFTIGGKDYELVPNAQIWPRALNSELGGTTDDIYLVAADNGAGNGGLDFINGFAWLQRFYTVFDTTNGQFGIANTEWTNASTN